MLRQFSDSYYEESISWLHFCLLHLYIWYIPCNYIFRKSIEVYLSVFRIRQQSYHRLGGLETTGIYFSVLEAGNQRSGCHHGLILVRALFWLADCRLLIGSGEQRKEPSFLMILLWAPVPLMRVPPSWPHLILVTSLGSTG